MVDASSELEVGAIRWVRDTNEDTAFIQGRRYEIFGMDFDNEHGASKVMASCGSGMTLFWAKT